jgi:beta-lactamase class A
VKTRFRRGIVLALGGLVAGYSLLHLPEATAGGVRPAPTAGTGAKAPATGAKPGNQAAAPAVDQQGLSLSPKDPLADLTGNLDAYLSGQTGDWGVYVVDLSTGQTATKQSQQMFPAASTIKLPLALYVYDQVSHGKASLDEAVTYQGSDWEDGAGYLADDLAPGDTQTVGQLVETMIRYSDNVAKNMLIDRFGQENLFAWIQGHGGQVELRDDGDGGLIYTNAETLGRMMSLLYTDQAFQNTVLQHQLLEYLQTTVYSDRAAAGVPEGVKVAHKIGDLPDVVNDVALVWAPNGPFVLAALSNGVTEEEGGATITALTSTAYQFLEEHHRSM